MLTISRCALVRNVTIAMCLLPVQAILISPLTQTATAAPTAVLPYPMRAKMLDANSLYHKDKWTEAIPIYSDVLSKHPNHVLALVLRGICYTRVKNYKKALEDFNAAVKQEPNNSRALQHRGYINYELGNYEQCVKDASKAILIDPRNRFAYRDRARGYAALGKMDLAKKDLEVKVKMYAAMRGFNSGVEMEQKGQLTKALNVFQSTFKKTPYVRSALYHRACIYSKYGMYEKSIELCNEFIKHNAGSIAGRSLRAVNYLQLGELDKALADADWAMQNNPDELDPYYVKGRVYTYKKKYPEAIQNYSEIIKLRPGKEPQALMERANVYSENGEPQKAIADYNELIKLEPKDETVYHHRGLLLLKLHEFDKALTDLQQFVKLSPKDPFALLALGDGYFQAGRYAEAIKNYDQAIAAENTSPTLYEARARAHEKLNNAKAADKDRKRAENLRSSDASY